VGFAEAQGDAGALAGLAGDLDLALVHLDDLPRQVQAEAVAAAGDGFAVGGAVELVEDARGRRRGCRSRCPAR
jgi:hypothetical protein